MKSSIITIGDEILIGQIVDTNSAWLGQELTGLGIEVDTIYSIADTEKAIVDTLDLAIEGSDLILITGGLGPTKDDVTKHSLNKYFNSDTYFDESLYNKIAAYFNMRGLPITDYLKEQCKMPEKAEILTNNVGTAPGMLFKHKGKIIVSMPGVPHEMKWIFEKSLKPNLDKYLKLEYIICQQTIKTVGIGETLIATMIEDVLHEMPDNISVAYLPGTGQVRIRLLSKTLVDNTEAIDHHAKKITDILEHRVFGYGTIALEEAVRDLFIKKGLTLSTAESCTGGYLAHRITSTSGSSAYYMGSFITYDNSFKQRFLNVSENTLKEHGAVSEATVKEMLEGLLQQTGTNIGVSISGIAGPNGGTEDKPVGTIWLAYGSKSDIRTKKLQLGKGREKNIEYTAVTALNMLRLFVGEG